MNAQVSQKVAEIIPFEKASRETEELNNDALNIVSEAKELQISNDTEAMSAADYLKSIKSKAKALTEKRLGMTRPLDESKKRIMDLFRAPIASLTSAEKIIKDKIFDYQKEVAAIAKKAAEEERKRIERNADRRAKTAENNGDEDAAESIRQEAEMEAAAAETTLASAPVINTGVTRRQNWVAECTDIKALAKAVAEGHAPTTLIAFNQKVGNQMAKALKGTQSYPGVNIFDKGSIAVR